MKPGLTTFISVVSVEQAEWLRNVPKQRGSRQVTPYEFEVPYMADASSLSPKFGIEMFSDILRDMEDGAVTLICLSGLTDAWQLLRTQHRLPQPSQARHA